MASVTITLAAESANALELVLCSQFIEVTADNHPDKDTVRQVSKLWNGTLSKVLRLHFEFWRAKFPAGPHAWWAPGPIIYGGRSAGSSME